MARDYAQRGNGRRQTRGSSSPGGGLPGWVWMIAGLSAGLAVAAAVWVARPTQGNAMVQAPPPPQVSAADRKRKDPPVPIPPEEKDRFTFYELLPNQEVLVPRETPAKAAGAPPAAAGTTGETYIIQVASFRSKEDAERQKASLALLGVESKIESVTIDSKDTYYRVRVGPERDINRVRLMQSRLENNGVPSMLVKVK